MPSTKEKLLKALDITLDDISEECLVAILLDAYKRNAQRITELLHANDRDQEILHNEREAMRREHHEMRCNPLYGATGEYYFLAGDGRKFCVVVEGKRIAAQERQGNINIIMQQLSHESFNK